MFNDHSEQWVSERVKGFPEFIATTSFALNELKETR